MPRSKVIQHARLAAIETLLLWEGEISNVRIRQVFALQPVQASRTLAAYKDAFPDALIEDSARRRYVPSARVRPQLTQGDISEYVELLRRCEAGLEPLTDVTVTFATADPRVFATLRSAALLGQGVEASYRSIAHPSGTSRLLFPHAIVRAGRRWHVRAWCASREAFLDFVLGRFVTTKLSAMPVPAHGRAAHDETWKERVTLLIAAHRRLDAAQAAVLRAEYFKGATARRITCSGALLPYIVHDLRLAVDPDQETPPDYQLELSNANSLKKWLFPAELDPVAGDG
ncbi:MAG TPA: WYL domain-containing protein [Rudaea sp.]|jgi:hypothetical protein